MSQSPDYRDLLHPDKSMFFFAGVYADHDAAEADYDAIKALHAKHDIGSYDAATITKDANGKVRVAKTEKPAQHGGWIGLAAGAGRPLSSRSSARSARRRGGRSRPGGLVRPPRARHQPSRGQGDRCAPRPGRRGADRHRHRPRCGEDPTGRGQREGTRAPAPDALGLGRGGTRRDRVDGQGRRHRAASGLAFVEVWRIVPCGAGGRSTRAAGPVCGERSTGPGGDGRPAVGVVLGAEIRAAPAPQGQPVVRAAAGCRTRCHPRLGRRLA